MQRIHTLQGLGTVGAGLNQMKEKTEPSQNAQRDHMQAQGPAVDHRAWLRRNTGPEDQDTASRSSDESDGSSYQYVNDK